MLLKVFGRQSWNVGRKITAAPPIVQTPSNNLPPKLQAFAPLLALSPVRPKYRDAQLPEVQEAFQFLLATAMHEE